MPMTEIEQLLTGSLTALVEQAEQQTALIAALDGRLRLLEHQVERCSARRGHR